MKFLSVLCVLCGLQVSAFSLDREAFTFTNYNLQVRIEPEQQRLAVRGTITLRNDSASPQKNLSLQISSSLAWRSITLSGKLVQFVSQPYTSDIDHTGVLSEAIVTLPQEIAPGSTLELDIGYEGTIPRDVTRLARIHIPEDIARRTDWDQIGDSFTAVRGIGYVAWYPIATEAAELAEKNAVFDTVDRWKAREASANLDFTLAYPTLPGEATAPIMLCNGKGLRIVTKGGRPQFPGLRCAYAPLRRTVPTLAIAFYRQLEKPPFTIYSLPNHKSEAEAYMSAAQKVTSFVSEWFGSPREAIAIAELPDPVFSPFDSGNLLLTPLNGSIDQIELAAVGKLTHAAFSSPRLWISEGLTHFAQALYRERQRGRPAALDFMKSHEDLMLDAEKDRTADDNGKAATFNSLVNTSTEELYRSKAMCVWWMLGDMVGEPALKKALADYQADQDKEPAYMQRLIEKQSHRDLEWFFDDWVYRDRGLPDFRVDSIYPRQTMQGNYIVTVTVENLGDAGAEVPVIVHAQDGESMQRIEVRAKSKNSIRIEVSSFPQEVVVNDGSVPESDVSNNVFKVKAAPKAQ